LTLFSLGCRELAPQSAGVDDAEAMAPQVGWLVELKAAVTTTEWMAVAASRGRRRAAMRPVAPKQGVQVDIVVITGCQLA
jgi:hypothetical protein